MKKIFIKTHDQLINYKENFHKLKDAFVIQNIEYSDRIRYSRWINGVIIYCIETSEDKVEIYLCEKIIDLESKKLKERGSIPPYFPKVRFNFRSHFETSHIVRFWPDKKQKLLDMIGSDICFNLEFGLSPTSFMLWDKSFVECFEELIFDENYISSFNDPEIIFIK